MLDTDKILVIIRSDSSQQIRISKLEVFVMVCTTVKEGAECAFMTKAGCGYNGGSCLPVIEQCEGCQRVLELPLGQYCSSYPNPSIKWKTSQCNFATHAKAASQTQPQAKINPLKASKRNIKRK
jgi:hypothetical protein